MINLLNLKDEKEWNEIVTSFSNYDVYYLVGYLKPFYIHGDGEPILLYYNNNGLRAIYAFMKRSLSEFMFDSITPYGYGGVLFEGDTSEENLKCFYCEYAQCMKSQNIIDNFVRYHPVLNNAQLMKGISNVIDLGKTIAMDLSSPGIIWENIISKNRNMIRKAEKNGVEIKHGKDFSLFKDFIQIYNLTMDKDNAEEYYYFGIDFYKSIYEDLKDNYEMFYAVCQGKIIAMSIIIFANHQMHYHLSGSLFEYRNLAPTNLLLYKAALWGCEQGYRTFHLGGGVGSGEDNLYKFKAAFNRKSQCQFSIGKEIFDLDCYKTLVDKRKNKNKDFDLNSSFFPLYRLD